MKKFRLKKGDTVKVIAGSEKGKVGKIVKLHRDSDRVIVDGVAKKIRHKKIASDGSGGRISVFVPIHISNVALYDVSSASVSKIGFVFNDVEVSSDSDDAGSSVNNSKKTKKRFIKSLKKEIN